MPPVPPGPQPTRIASAGTPNQPSASRLVMRCLRKPDRGRRPANVSDTAMIAQPGVRVDAASVGKGWLISGMPVRSPHATLKAVAIAPIRAGVGPNAVVRWAARDAMVSPDPKPSIDSSGGWSRRAALRTYVPPALAVLVAASGQ